MLDQSSSRPDDFELSDYAIEQLQFAYPLSENPIDLKVSFEANLAEHLYETPLTVIQKLSTLADERTLLETTITNSWELRWWLQGFGYHVEILEPENLRQYFIDLSQKMGDLYLAE